ncbi:MAG TPA: hypothetical protein VFJ58_17280 [Armatimonadota bacterium]|nr:hypothetical protein [Armatimonadota bacterium]
MPVVISDRWSAAIAFTRYTHSAPAAMMLVAACLHQLRHGDGAYFAWSEREISRDLGIKRRTILTARRSLRQLGLMDWDAQSGRREAYVVNTDRVALILGAETIPPPAGESNPARSEQGMPAHRPAYHPNPARLEPDATENAPAEDPDPARLEPDATENAPASPPDPARPDAADAPPGPPHPPVLGTKAFNNTYTRYASAGAAPATNYQSEEEPPRQSAPADPSDGDTPPADPPCEAACDLLKRCGLTASQIRAATQRYTGVQITQAVDRVRDLRRAGRCAKPVAMLVKLLKSGDWPTPVDISAFDEPPTQMVHAGSPAPPPGRACLPPPQPWETLQDRAKIIGEYMSTLPPLPKEFFGFTERGSNRGALRGERSALCAGS